MLDIFFKVRTFLDLMEDLALKVVGLVKTVLVMLQNLLL